MYIYLNERKQLTDVELLLLYSNTWNHQGENESSLFILYICIKSIWY